MQACEIRKRPIGAEVTYGLVKKGQITTVQITSYRVELKNKESLKCSMRRTQS